ncbi:hypothetical protein J6590_076247 [Homalodisca vitripennis]|nr:hypothetical protein J6590_076247 [Homalodisca vitripennis]
MFHMERLLRTRQMQHQGTKSLVMYEVQEMSDLARSCIPSLPSKLSRKRLSIISGARKQRNKIRLLTALNQ